MERVKTMTQLFDLTGKKALVTGSGSGLGLGMAEGLLEAGAEVVLTGVTDKVLSEAERLRNNGFKAHAVQADLAEERNIRELFLKALSLLNGRVDILINSAGIQRRNKCEDFSLADFDEVLDVNLRAVFILCQLAGREMLKQGSGKIINIASMNCVFGGIFIPAYAASKGGVMQMTRTFGNEWISRGVNVNCIAPGYMDTAMCAALKADDVRNKETLDRIPAHRWGKPSDMKGAAVFLSSAASDYMSGAVIPVDGGYLSR
jgi:2-deoxy-D-gluconate 3-dehydrogenase